MRKDQVVDSLIPVGGQSGGDVMPVRNIITIDEEKCNGCGDCITGCAEGALQLVDGKARLVKEQYCDGFGDCIGECPTGALKIEQRESEEFDEAATAEHVRKEGGEDAVKRMMAAGAAHDAGAAPARQPPPGGCPGTRMRFAEKTDAAAEAPVSGVETGHVLQSDLQQWPVQIHLVSPGAPFFSNKELVVLSTCAPTASADVHWRFIRGRGIAVGCPKLDRTEGYAEKLGAILQDATIPKVIVVRMEVPCCGGLTAIVKDAVGISGRTDLVAEEVTVSLSGDIIGTRPLTA